MVVVIGRTVRKVPVRLKGSANKALVRRVIVVRAQIVAHDQKDREVVIVVLVPNAAQGQKDRVAEIVVLVRIEALVPSVVQGRKDKAVEIAAHVRKVRRVVVNVVPGQRVKEETAAVVAEVVAAAAVATVPLVAAVAKRPIRLPREPDPPCLRASDRAFQRLFRTACVPS